MEQEIDVKVVERIHKLLKLARDGGATEGEANNAMAMAERLMLANNLSLAQMELRGEAAAERRLKQQAKGKANYRWQRWMMTAVAEANFCHLLVLTGKRRNRHGTREISLGYEIIGRISNVTAAQHMYDYLLQTCARMRQEYEMKPGNRAADGALFVEGLASRLAERVKERHDDLMDEQRKEDERKRREAAVRSSHPASASSGNALVVVLDDFAQKEKDLNNDLAKGWEPGKTLAMREANELERERLQQLYREQESRIQQLMKEHSISYGVAWNMVHLNQSLKEAQAYEELWQKEQAKESRRSSRGGWGRTREDRLRDRLNEGAAREGRRAANEVSLDKQVESSPARRIK